MSITLLAKRAREDRVNAKLLAQLALEADDYTPMRPNAGATPGGDPDAARGVPLLVKGGRGGAIRGTRPGDGLP